MTALARKIRICLFPKNSSSLIRKTDVTVSLYFSTYVDKQHSVSTPPVYEFLMNKHHFSPQAASRVASVLPHLKNPQESDLILSFLKESGFSIAQLEKTMKSKPKCLNANLEKSIKPKITIFQDMGFSGNEIANIISNNPVILQCSVKDRIIPSLSVLKGILGSSVEVSKVLRISSWALSIDLEKNMVPNIEFLKSCGIPLKQIIRHIYFRPTFLLNNQETMRKSVDKADAMGVDRSCKTFVYAVQVVSQTSKIWDFKLKTFRDMGFSEDDILRVFRYAPLVFTVSEVKIKKVKEVLLETGKYDVSCIVNYPKSLMFSVEKRYKPRLQVLGSLEKMNLIKIWPSLSVLCHTTDKKFCEKFVAPFIDELGDVKLARKDVIKS
ncbi:hypothetical protein ACJIZ3_014018 [Penstemon smallii]|uniref:Uncharacterized protein n=1 Tax=Penstemon smallii TaxID=265156 RepID=A0ABD3RIC7_9LAMI